MNARDLLGGSTRRPTGWAAELRFREKASLLRAGTADFAQDLLEADQQLAISVSFLETSSAFAAKLAGRGWRVGEINGERHGDDLRQLDCAVPHVVDDQGAGALAARHFVAVQRDRLGDGEDRDVELPLLESDTRRLVGGEEAMIYFAYAEGR